MATTRKTTKRTAKGGKAQKKNTVRTVKHGNVTYSSRPQENPGCSPRCSPPYRYVSQATGLKTTTVKYSHRNLAITSPDGAPKRTAKKTTAKKTPAKTAKAPVKAVKKVTAKAPAAKKAPAKKTVKAPVKKAPAKTVSCGCAVSPAKQSKPKTVTCGCAQTPAQVKKAILNRAEKEGMNRKELDKHIIVATIPKTEAKAPIKAPASWKVPAIGGKFEGKEPAKKTAAKKTASKEVTIRMSAPLSVQKRVLAKKNAMAKAKEVPDLLDPERPRPDHEYTLRGKESYGYPVKKEDPLAKVTFAHIYSQAASERIGIDMPPKTYHVVEHNGKYYVKDGTQIVSLKKDTKEEAFELAMRMAKTYKGRVVAQFKVPRSNPPRYRFKTIG